MDARQIAAQILLDCLNDDNSAFFDDLMQSLGEEAEEWDNTTPVSES